MRASGSSTRFLYFVFFPFLFTNLAVEITLWFFLNVLLGPCMALLWRTRRHLADAGAVELTRNPDALASALQRLSEDSTVVAGGSWATHLFIVNPSGDRSLRGLAPPADQQGKALEAWRATENVGRAVLPAVNPVSPTRAQTGEYARVRKEMMSTAMSAAIGNTDALARMQAFARVMGGDPALGLHDMPNLNDIILAQRGDRAAMARMRVLRQTRHQEGQPKRGQTGLRTHSFVSFHPPLNKRAKRLQKMGAHLTSPTRTGSSVVLKIVLALLYLVIVPLMVVAGVLILVVIAMMIGLNLLFLALWLTLIHWAFAQDGAKNTRTFVGFIKELTEAFSRSG